MALTFFKCQKCGKIIEMIRNSPCPTMCCGEAMTELVPGTSDGAAEKHVPSVSTDGHQVTVQIGDVIHPMFEKHYIEWIAIETSEGSQRKALAPGGEPKAVFALAEGETPAAAYTYCNLHGLWKKEF